MLLTIPRFLWNLGFYYRYYYDVRKNNIYEVTMIPLHRQGKNIETNFLGRVIDGTTVGRRKRTLLMKPRGKSDYIFKLRAYIKGYGSFQGTVKIKYLIYTKIILEAELMEEGTTFLFHYSPKDKDYILDPTYSPKYRGNKNMFEEIMESVKEREIVHESYSMKEIFQRFFGGIIYAILAEPVVYGYELLLVYLFQSGK